MRKEFKNGDGPPKFRLSKVQALMDAVMLVKSRLRHVDVSQASTEEKLQQMTRKRDGSVVVQNDLPAELAGKLAARRAANRLAEALQKKVAGQSGTVAESVAARKSMAARNTVVSRKSVAP